MIINIFGTEDDTFVSWRDSPNTRGTWDLILSCLFTLFLCVYTAVHINIPESGDSQRPWYWQQSFWSKVGCVVIGILAPEIMLYIAFMEFRDASKLAKFMNRGIQRSDTLDVNSHTGDSKSKSGEKQRRSKWSRKEAFYVVMGGMAIDVSDQPLHFVETEPTSWVVGSKKRRYVLEADGFMFLQQYFPEIVPGVSLENLDDRNKSNALAKTIAVLQGIWFCVQIVSRMIAKLPISLLELNTFGHACCALIIYLFWWDKPYDIGEATVIDDPKRLPVLAYLRIRQLESKNFVSRLKSAIKPQKGNSDGLELSNSYNDKVDESLLGGEIDIWRGGTIVLKPKDCITGTMLQNNTETDMSISSEDVRLAQLAFRCWLWRGGESEDEKANKIFVQESDWRATRRNHIGMFSYDKITQHHFEGFSALLLFVSTVYGGLHMFAWNAPFQTGVERALWRSSSLVVLTSLPSIWAFAIVLRLLQLRDEAFEFLFIGATIAIIAAYVVARAYLIVECFISLRHLPEGIYTIPSFTSYFPHI